MTSAGSDDVPCMVVVDLVPVGYEEPFSDPGHRVWHRSESSRRPLIRVRIRIRVRVRIVGSGDDGQG